MDTNAYIDAVVSHAQLTGRFERVNKIEPKSAPGTGINCSVWCKYLGPVAGFSGLAATSAILALSVRLYMPMISGSIDEDDLIDGSLMDATDDLLTRYSADFQLDGLVMAVDLLGLAGQGPLAAESGYVQIGGASSIFRTFTINVPLLVADAYPQVA